MKPFCPIPQAIEQIKKKNTIILVDNPQRENEGDLFIPAEIATAQKINFMIKKAGGLVCVPITKALSAKLNLPLMIAPQNNTEKTKINFTVSVNAKQGITTGISAFDRAKTIKTLTHPLVKPSQLTVPGHVFPVVAASGGLSQRQGHTEAAIELARLAGYSPAGVLCEIVRDDGRMAKLPDLIKLAEKFNLKIVSIDDLIAYLKLRPRVVKTASAALPTEYGNFQVHIYKSLLNNRQHAALLMGKRTQQPMLTRIHSQCLTGDTFHSLKCDCRQQLHRAMELIAQKGDGLILYLGQEGRGIGLTDKIKAYHLQENGLDTVAANQKLGHAPDERNYRVAANILTHLGIKQVELLTNNPDKVNQLTAYGIQVVRRIPLEITPNQFNRNYLKTKKRKLKHQLTLA